MCWHWRCGWTLGCRLVRLPLGLGTICNNDCGRDESHVPLNGHAPFRWPIHAVCLTLTIDTHKQCILGLRLQLTSMFQVDEDWSAELVGTGEIGGRIVYQFIGSMTGDRP